MHVLVICLQRASWHCNADRDVVSHRKLICPEHEAPTDYPLITRFCIGPLENVVNSSVPYVLLFNNTGSPALSIVLNLVLFLLVYSGNVTALATSAREMWAFARDHGLPGSGWLGRMDREHTKFLAALSNTC